MSASPPSQSPLLALAPELRNRIYEHCLIENDEVTISEELKSPALTDTCRQIRREALGLWYTMNIFRAIIRDCNAALLIKFLSHCSDIGFILEVSLLYEDGFDWKNLKAWIRAVWEDGRPATDFPDPCDMVKAALDIANEMTARPWEEIERALESLRYAIRTYASDWDDKAEADQATMQA